MLGQDALFACKIPQFAGNCATIVQQTRLAATVHVRHCRKNRTNQRCRHIRNSSHPGPSRNRQGLRLANSFGIERGWQTDSGADRRIRTGTGICSRQIRHGRVHNDEFGKARAEVVGHLLLAQWITSTLRTDRVLSHFCHSSSMCF
jgi:hypothetical protein